ncbi:MAG: type II toxin-antitoxin system RelE/ParE family toxin [Bacteroidota bacterium]
MARQIVWNKRAVASFDEIVEYLEENISEATAEKFVNDLYILIEKIDKYPEIGRKTKNRKTVRQYKIDKYRKLYYRKHGRKLIIIFLFDERRNPISNPYK